MYGKENEKMQLPMKVACLVAPTLFSQQQQRPTTPLIIIIIIIGPTTSQQPTKNQPTNQPTNNYQQPALLEANQDHKNSVCVDVGIWLWSQRKRWAITGELIHMCLVVRKTCSEIQSGISADKLAAVIKQRSREQEGPPLRTKKRHR